MSAPKANKWVLGVWDGNALRPYAPYDHEMMQRLPVGTPVRLQFAQPRSLPRHRLYWVVLRLVIKNSEVFATEEALHKVLLVGCGVTEPFLDLDGNISLIPSSTAFDKMSEEEFKAYFDRAMEIIETKIIPGVSLQLLLREAKSQANFKDKEAA